MTKGRSCPICGCSEKKKIFDVNFSDDISKFLDRKNEIVICKVCGFAYADNDNSQINYDNYYTNYNIYSENADIKILDHNYAPPIMQIIENYCSKEKRLIDVGAGNGLLLKTLKKRGFSNLYSMDPSHKSTQKIKSLGIEASTQSIFDKIPESNISCFDVVCSTGVAEHIFDLNKYMYQISSLLRGGGRFVVEVPSVEGFEKKYFPLPNYFNHEHINYFSLKTLDRLCSKFLFKRISSDEEAFVQTAFGEWSLQAVYAKQNEVKVNISKDRISEESILHYYNKHLAKETNILQHIIDFIMEHKKVVLWGCGSYAIQFLTKFSELKRHIAYCVDNNSLHQGNIFHGIQVFSPNKLLSDPMPVIIFSMLNSNDIISQIKKMGLDVDVFAIGS